MQHLNTIYFLTSFLLLTVVQALFINGVKSSFDEGMIFEKYGKWVKSLGWYSKPMGSCIRCMSSIWGGILYWPSVLGVYGFNFWQIPVFIADVFCVSVLSWYFYKKL